MLSEKDKIKKHILLKEMRRTMVSLEEQADYYERLSENCNGTETGRSCKKFVSACKEIMEDLDKDIKLLQNLLF